MLCWPRRSQGTSQSPKGVFNALVDRAPQFKGRQQHDSHELLRVLLDGLEVRTPPPLYPAATPTPVARAAATQLSTTRGWASVVGGSH